MKQLDHVSSLVIFESLNVPAGRSTYFGMFLFFKEAFPGFTFKYFFCGKDLTKTTAVECFLAFGDRTISL